MTERRTPVRLFILICGVALWTSTAGQLQAQAHSHDHMSPYSGFMDREIKALSPEEMAGLLDGEGLGMALPAELNGFPGPMHVLEMRDMLGLTDEQKSEIQSVFDDMQSRARALGRDIVELERELDIGFAEGTITETRMIELLEAIGEKRAHLRAAHLRAHLEVTPLLTESQRQHYSRARGYGG